MATVIELVDAFLAEVKDRRSLATHTHYTKRLKPFVARFGTRQFAELTPMEIKSYISAVNRFAPPHKRAGELKANATRASNAIVLQLLEAFAIEVRDMPGPILPKLDVPIGARREEMPTPADAKAILKIANAEFSTIYRAMRMTGARPSELVIATFANWNHEKKEIVLEVHKTAEKTGDKRKIPIGKKLAAILAIATGTRTEGPLFLNTLGKQWTVPAFSKSFSRYRDQCGIKRSIVLYCTRHATATELCKKGSIEDAAEALNHKNIQTTRGYIHKEQQTLLDNQDLMDDVTADDDEPPEVLDQNKAA